MRNLPHVEGKMASPVAVQARGTATPTIEKPSCFQDALAEGWEVLKDDSKQPRNEKRREGKLTLGKQGVSQRLEVEYLGTTKGFRFAVPKFV
jgi:hypothetical protein